MAGKCFEISAGDDAWAKPDCSLNRQTQSESAMHRMNFLNLLSLGVMKRFISAMDYGTWVSLFSKQSIDDPCKGGLKGM